MSGNLLNSSAVMAFFAIPSTVIWSYLAFGVALAIGLVTTFFAAIGKRREDGTS